MKIKLLLVLGAASFILTNTMLAQTDLVEKVGLQSYVGAWKYESGNEMVVLRIRDTVRFSIAGNSTDSCLAGTYKYTRNDTVIVDNMDMYHYSGDPMHMPVYLILGPEDAMGNVFSMCMFFEDTKTGKSSLYCRINYFFGRHAPQLTWHLVDEKDTIIWETFGSDDEEYNDYMRKKKIAGWSIPNDITFVKVE